MVFGLLILKIQDCILYICIYISNINMVHHHQYKSIIAVAYFCKPQLVLCTQFVDLKLLYKSQLVLGTQSAYWINKKCVLRKRYANPNWYCIPNLWISNHYANPNWYWGPNLDFNPVLDDASVKVTRFMLPIWNSKTRAWSKITNWECFPIWKIQIGKIPIWVPNLDPLPPKLVSFRLLCKE